MANDYDYSCVQFSWLSHLLSKKVEDKNLIEFWDSSEIFLQFSPTPTSQSEEQSFLYSTEIDPMFEAKSHKS